MGNKILRPFFPLLKLVASVVCCALSDMALILLASNREEGRTMWHSVANCVVRCREAYVMWCGGWSCLKCEIGIDWDPSYPPTTKRVRSSITHTLTHARAEILQIRTTPWSGFQLVSFCSDSFRYGVKVKEIRFVTRDRKKPPHPWARKTFWRMKMQQALGEYSFRVTITSFMVYRLPPLRRILLKRVTRLQWAFFQQSDYLSFEKNNCSLTSQRLCFYLFHMWGSDCLKINQKSRSENVFKFLFGVSMKLQLNIYYVKYSDSYQI